MHWCQFVGLLSLKTLKIFLLSNTNELRFVKNHILLNILHEHALCVYTLNSRDSTEGERARKDINIPVCKHTISIFAKFKARKKN